MELLDILTLFAIHLSVTFFKIVGDCGYLFRWIILTISVTSSKIRKTVQFKKGTSYPKILVTFEVLKKCQSVLTYRESVIRQLSSSFVDINQLTLPHTIIQVTQNEELSLWPLIHPLHRFVSLQIFCELMDG